MKKILLIPFFLTLYSVLAQCSANDSTSMGAQTSNDVFYSLNSKVIATVSNTNWHLAFSVQSSDYMKNPAGGVAIRVNSGGNGTYLKRIPGASYSNWRSIDTTGLYALPILLDSDSTWNLSAFTSNYPNVSDPFDFMWGRYNQTTHVVSGTSVYVLYNVSQGWYKKVFINECAYDTSWNFTIANVDNTDSNNVRFLKKTYPNKMFVYYDAVSNTLLDREPNKDLWDLLWTKYITYVSSPQGSGNYPVSGVLSNPSITVEQNYGKKCNEVWVMNKSSKPDPRISVIGYDWKTFTGTAYLITDTFVYFIKTANASVYKLTFVKFVGGSSGKSTFNVYETNTGINSNYASDQIRIYPNPSKKQIVFDTDLDILNILVYDMNGKQVIIDIHDSTIDISNIQSGMYNLAVFTNAGVYFQYFIKE